MPKSPRSSRQEGCELLFKGGVDNPTVYFSLLGRERTEQESNQDFPLSQEQTRNHTIQGSKWFMGYLVAPSFAHFYFDLRYFYDTELFTKLNFMSEKDYPRN